MAKWLLKWGIRNGMVKISGLSLEERPVVKTRVFKSQDGLPPDVAAQLERVRQSGSTVVSYRDNMTGRSQTFNSWDEVPDDVKRRLPQDIMAKMEDVGQSAGTVIKFWDETTGEDRTFTSWGEVPEELQARIPAEIRQRMIANLDTALQEASPVEVGPDEIVVQEATTSKVLDFKIKGIQFGG